MPYQEHEREREQTYSYWYIPSAPRVNYSLLVMESAGMMKMATGEGSAPPAGCRNRAPIGFWWLQRLAAVELLIWLFREGFSIYRNFWHRFHVRGGLRAVHEIGGTP